MEVSRNDSFKKQMHTRDQFASLRTGHASGWQQLRPEFLSQDQVFDAWSDVLSRCGQPGHPEGLRVYVHFPFCKPECRYCMYWHLCPDDQTFVRAYVDYLTALVLRFREKFGQLKVTSAYFGGGTPSLIPADAMARFLEAFGRAFVVQRDFTCEANATSLDVQKISCLADAGVNRLSIGVQSLDAAVQKIIGRRTPALEVIARLITHGRSLGIETNLDLVAGLPGQTPESLRSDVEALLTTGTDSIIVYRYQPVSALPDSPDPCMCLPALFDRDFRKGLAAAGYECSKVDSDRAFKVELTRKVKVFVDVEKTVEHVFVPAASALRSLSSSLGLNAVVRRLISGELDYSLFDDPSANLLGLGSGSYSHIYGRAWLRECTTPQAVVSGAPPAYVGSRLSLEDECRSMVIEAVSNGRPLDARLAYIKTGIDPFRSFPIAMSNALRSGLLKPSILDRALEGKIDVLSRLAGRERLEHLLNFVLPQERSAPSFWLEYLRHILLKGIAPGRFDVDRSTGSSVEHFVNEMLDGVAAGPPPCDLPVWLDGSTLQPELVPFAIPKAHPFK